MTYINNEGKPIADININSNGIIDFPSDPIVSDENYKFSTWLDNDAENKFIQHHLDAGLSIITYQTAETGEFLSACEKFGWKPSEFFTCTEEFLSVNCLICYN